jgi:energy-coupling factor transport system ATP-binding protein
VLMELRSISHNYQSGTPFAQCALQDINLSVQEKEFLVIAGAEGSGKTTLLLIMAGLIKPDQGQVYYQQQPLPRQGIHPHFGVVFQHPEQQMFELTVGEEIAFGPINRGIKGEELQSDIAKALTAVGLEPALYQHRRIKDLSSGEKRRVALASILVMAPRVLIMDEPLVGLDYSGRRQLIRYLVELNRHQGITVIMVTHEIRPVYPYCSRIIQLSQGKMVRSIKPEQSTAIAGIDHTEEIELPLHVKLLHRLRQANPALPASTRTAQEAAAIIAHWKQGEGGCH